MKWEWNFERTLQTSVRHGKLSLANSQVTISRSLWVTLFDISILNWWMFASGMPLLHNSKKSLREPLALSQGWKKLLRWFMNHRNAGMWRVWVDVGWINHGNCFVPPPMNCHSSHHIHGNSIQKHWMIDNCRLHTCNDDHRKIWKSCLGIVFCTNDAAYQVVNAGLISL